MPGVYVELEKMPLTANGKVDRKGLPMPEWSVEVKEYVGPRTPVEEMMAGIWQEVLKVEKVGVNDNFFDMGGDSITSLQVVDSILIQWRV